MRPYFLMAMLCSAGPALGAPEAPTVQVRCDEPRELDLDALRRSLTLYLQEFSPVFDGEVDPARLQFRCERSPGGGFRGVLVDRQGATTRFELTEGELQSAELPRLVGLKARSLVTIAQITAAAPAPTPALVAPQPEVKEPAFVLGVAPELAFSYAFRQPLLGASVEAAVRLGPFRLGLNGRWNQPERVVTALGEGTTERLYAGLSASLRLPGEVPIFRAHYLVARAGVQRQATRGTLFETRERRGTEAAALVLSLGWMPTWHLVGPLWWSLGPRIDFIPAPLTVLVHDTAVFTAPWVSPALDLRVWWGL
ncbi:MAG: hypothetical protein Q8N23_28875 [Archangium sp.]|nr:hypothetical protein [Archangium sp.]MDP3156720.1 hypothetical protein [Archangium sp.]MDP3574662.1 hypothetical protein [Archangium sp.]